MKKLVHRPYMRNLGNSRGWKGKRERFDECGRVWAPKADNDKGGRGQDM